jgi:membrane protease YdiL (CAAX protease family)
VHTHITARIRTMLYAIAVLVGTLGVWMILATALTGFISEPMMATAVFDGIIFCLAVAARRFFRHRFRIDREISPSRGRDWFWLQVVVGLVLVFLAGEAVSIAIYDAFGSSGFDIVQHQHQSAGSGLVLVVSVLLAPMGEESLNRGVIYPLLRRELGIVTSLIITTVVFACLHGNIVQAVAVLPLSVLLVLVYERSQRLWPVIIGHAAFNAGSQVVPVGVIQALAIPVVAAVLVTAVIISLVGLYWSVRPVESRRAQTTGRL